jgi:hypothetical protein
MIRFVEVVQTVITINYSAFANTHTLQFTIIRTKSSQSAVFSLAIAWQQITTM